MRVAVSLVWFMCLGACCVGSFVLRTDAINMRPSRKTSIVGPSRISPTLLSEDKQQASGGVAEVDVQADLRLVLDHEGRLKIDDGKEGLIILDGLSSSVWTSTRPPRRLSSTDVEESLFLHTSHASERAQHESALGELVSCHGLLACSRLTRYWMGPSFGNGKGDGNNKYVPHDTQFLLIEVCKGGPYALLLPLVDGGFRASLNSGGPNIELVCHSESGDASVVSSQMRALYASIGHDPFELLKRGFAHVADTTGTFATLDRKKLPQSVDEFGWCTWDAFYSEVTPKGVLEGVTSLKDAGVPPRTLILDDGWQEVTPLKKPKESPTSRIEQSLVKRVSSQVVNRILATLTNAVNSFYERFVQKSSHGSLANRIWRFLSKTVLKPGLWDYFDTETDFARQLSGFLPNRKFQEEGKSGMEGLAKLVSHLKDQLGVQRVFCWHALHGYWRGVSPELGKRVGINSIANVIPRPTSHLLRIEPQLAWDTVSLFGVGLVTDESDLSKLYEHLHTPLVHAGIDGVKVDVQSGVSAVGGGVGGGPHLARIYTEAMEASVSKRFAHDGAANCINCMCHSTENLYRYKTTSVARASDDFYPQRPNSHTVHLINVAYNSLFIGEICLPDWDMFHSKHESASLHAAARAIGGCPVYVSDGPNQHDTTLLKRLVLPDGGVLRAKLPGRPTRDCLFADVAADGESLLKIWNMNSIGGVVGAFNVQGVAWNFDTHEHEVVHSSPPPLSARIKPHDVETLRDKAGPFAVWRCGTSTLDFLPSGESSVEVELNHREWEIFTIVPVQTSDNGVALGVIGLVNMLNSGGAISEIGELQDIPASENTSSSMTSAEFISRGPGTLVAYCQPRPSRISIVNGDNPDVDIVFTHKESSGKLSFPLPVEKGAPHRVKIVWKGDIADP